jgi:hypothetical protein
VQALDVKLLLSLLVAFTLVIPASVYAESGGIENRISRLHDEAVQAYFNLEVDSASDLLERAIELAEREELSGSLVARLHLTYATVLILGHNRLADGRAQMVLAIQTDPSIETDPNLSAPLVNQIWEDVRSEHGSSSTNGGSGEPDDSDVRVFGQPTVNVTPVPEQLPQHAIPIYVELEQATEVGRVLLGYRGPGMRRYLRIQMEAHQDGYAARIACHRVLEPEVEYLIEVLDTNGEVIANAGTEDEPLRVAVRRELENAPPSLPGEPPEPPCTEDQREETPVGPATRNRIMYFEVGIGTGAGIPSAGSPEEVGCHTTTGPAVDRITINPAIAWTELVLFPEIGFYIGRNLAIGIRGRFGIPGAIYPGAPITWGALARVRWFVLPNDPFRLSLYLGGGYVNVSHPIALQGAVNCDTSYDWQDGIAIYHRIAGAGMVQLGGEFLWDIHRSFAIGVEIDVSALFPTFAVQGDLFLVLDASF